VVSLEGDPTGRSLWVAQTSSDNQAWLVEHVQPGIPVDSISGECGLSGALFESWARGHAAAGTCCPHRQSTAVI
jgi:hypothetical protein